MNNAFSRALQLTNAKFVDVKQHTSFMTIQGTSENSPLERPKLQKFLADAGLCSRRKGENWILEERVTINGKVARLGERVSTLDDVVKVNGKVVHFQFPKLLTIAINKPMGYACSNHDEFAERLIFELLPNNLLQTRLFCAGRLDVESEGLVIVTNNGSLAHKLTHPSQQIRKRYQVELKQPLSGEDLPLMVQGIEDEGQFLRIDEIKAKGKSPIGKTRLDVILGHGKKKGDSSGFWTFPLSDKETKKSLNRRISS